MKPEAGTEVWREGGKEPLNWPPISSFTREKMAQARTGGTEVDSLSLSSAFVLVDVRTEKKKEGRCCESVFADRQT